MDIQTVATYPTGRVIIPKSASTQFEIVSHQDNIGEQQDLEKKDETKLLPENEVQDMTDELNDFMEYINTDIRFVLHQKTETLMVQVVDVAKNKVLREAPPRDFLDSLARLHEFVGALLDKKV
ncbi:flagellar protein FlaG [Sporomusa acidovorans]|uniref:Flagellar protein FlaG n=1 Tax=Sporomusa acidovorans (strain ATCC 49682 / DSM 3132 / Mol) TaxID=1123286 RepID=A0ABZ3J7N1_SPOA4|nr:flagellar protein FlaG [Sporomusa acidovorans]OZC19415.1 flagellar protein FlaG [Sporomusa acidovorans DSM 3132]SDD77202.1 flagellar protein FlaG [Sporomusa acidovorans]